ncbi:serine protease [Streptomyces sp. V2]|uniref:serine protease n=1 Tax=Streptomyces sp. V2 TaxID=1424099 RepID=UPI001F0CB7DB|nr:serine protease [Streptomyces sp. V2]
MLPVERGVTVREFAAFTGGAASVLALVGPPGSGRTTELAALAARRYRAAEPAPTLWLRGADLRDEDESLADAAARALRRAARIVTTSQAPTSPPDPETITPADLSRTALTAGRPLFLLLDGPEEMPPVLAHRLAAWTAGTVTWLRETGARLVVACRAEYWEAAGAGFPRDMLHGTRTPNPRDQATPTRTHHPEPTAPLPRTPQTGAPEPKRHGADAVNPGNVPHPGPATAGAGMAGGGQLDGPHPGDPTAGVGVAGGQLNGPALGDPTTGVGVSAGGQLNGLAPGDPTTGVGVPAGGELNGPHPGNLTAVSPDPAVQATRSPHPETSPALEERSAETQATRPTPADPRQPYPPSETTPPDTVPSHPAPAPSHWARDASAPAPAPSHPAPDTRAPNPAVTSTTSVTPTTSATHTPTTPTTPTTLATPTTPGTLSTPVTLMASATSTTPATPTTSVTLTTPTTPTTSATPTTPVTPTTSTTPTTPQPPSTAPHHPARPALEDKAPSGPERGAGGAAPGDGTGRGGGGEGGLPECVELGEFTAGEAEIARARYRVPAFALAPNAVRHPLSIRLLSEIRAALPDVPPPANAEREDIFAAYLDLMCLRIAVRLAAGNNLRGTDVKRLAARVSGQVHEAARRSLGPGQGELDRTAFEEVFPWGHAPGRPGGVTGWASAVLAEGLIVPAGTGYRFAHEELADWIQGMHLDLEEALRSLAHRPRGTHLVPVPHHRIGPVVQSLLLVARQQGPAELASHLRKLTRALDETPDAWWPARLLTETLLRVPDATPYLDVLHALADHVVARETLRPTTFLPSFWTSLNLPSAPLFTLLRHLLRADPPSGETSAPRYLDAVATLLAADAGTVQPHLTLWFEDDRPLPGAPEATVAAAAQALLYAYRDRALDDLTDVLVGCGHHRADELLGALAEDEPSAVCRAVDRWARDTRPARRVAAVSYGLRAAPHVTTDADRDLLRYAAEELLTEPPLQGGALGLLVQDPRIRTAHLPQTLAHFMAADPQLPPTALLPALRTHTEPVLKAFRTRLARPDTDPTTTLRALAEVTAQPLARRIAIMVRETVERRPETARAVAEYVEVRLRQGPPARPVLHPLVTALLTASAQEVRSALAGVLATPDGSPLRTELREFLLAHEQDPAVLTSFLHAAAHHRSRDLVHRAGRLLVRTPDGATRFDRGLVDLGRHVPGFAARVAAWIGEAPQEWATVVGPGARRMIENLAGAGVPV